MQGTSQLSMLMRIAQNQPAPTPKPFASQSDLKPTTTTSGASTKAKFVPLMSTEGQSRMAVHVPGRHPCNCLGQKHTLVNNCLECGRIVCSQVRHEQSQQTKSNIYFVAGLKARSHGLCKVDQMRIQSGSSAFT